MSKKRSFESAEIVADEEGRMYHIGVAPGEVAPYILTTGDPARARRVATYLDDVKPELTSREYVTITGSYQGIPVSVMATGMGPDNTEIAIVELAQVVEKPTLIRIGSCGALKKGITLAELVVSTGAVRLENTSTHFVIEGYPAVAHHECVMAILQAAQNKGFPFHTGLTATGSGFYGAQGRNVPGFPPRNPDIFEQLERMNVANFEMEASCMFTLGSLSDIRTGAVCAVYADRHANKFIDSETKELAEQRCIETGLETIVMLAKMDQQKEGAKHWLPSMGL